MTCKVFNPTEGMTISSMFVLAKEVKRKILERVTSIASDDNVVKDAVSGTDVGSDAVRRLLCLLISASLHV